MVTVRFIQNATPAELLEIAKEIYKEEIKLVKSSFLLFKNDFKFQLGFKVVV